MTEVLTVTGIGVCGGRAVGRAHRAGPAVAEPDVRPDAVPADDRPAEAARAEAALVAVAEGYESLAATAPAEVAEVITADAMMARDPVLAGGARDGVLSRGLSAEAAVWTAAGELRERLRGLGGYLAERAADLDDVRVRAVCHLRGEPATRARPADGPHILVADDLSPADTAALDLSQVSAFVTERGGPTSHTAILARMLGIPAVVACPGAADIEAGRLIAVHGDTGLVDLRPPADEPVTVPRPRSAEPLSWAGELADGTPVGLLANVEGEPSAVASAGAGGVGLLRTELLFLDRPTAPTRDEQAEVYRRLFRHFPGRRVVVRTWDAGADKPLAFLGFPDEPNPALGVRGYRATPVGSAALDTQLDAIASAAADTDAEVWVMAPMVSTPVEAAEFAAAVRRRGLSPGVMIEVPAAALAADRILAEVDFVSIGTNDLAQYTFAADRLATALAALHDPWQPPLLRLIEMVGAAGAAAGKPVGVCGEAAGDPKLAPVLIGLGVSSLSAAPIALPALATALTGLTLADCRAQARAALGSPS
ncbi:phosphoenolpyruvate--protein phosphotransferase [Pseudonocardia eucalypti]|uniref:Phosphoenolpyruvate-protein phosphotransferase n=1 Tax=Pseudonocardia eucalypti TaxID=648755 RepID=A0ABP9RC13_9PSEU|nr:phosphotransferase system enzyme I (PtsI) [Pseudonocardia eucalypti]